MRRALRRAAVLALLLGACLTWSGAGSARQDDPRLDRLFANLQSTQSEEQAEALAEEIWEIWLEHGSEHIDKLMARGVQAMTRQDFSTALVVFDEMVARAPGFAEGWNKRATVHYLMGNYRASQEDVEKTLALEPRHFGALAGLGLIHLARGDEKPALAAFERALRVNPHMRVIKLRVRELQERLQGRPI